MPRSFASALRHRVRTLCAVEVEVQNRPIGVFDSGLGGLTVVHALADLLPHEDLIYLGDTARYPYGDRTGAEVLAFSRAIASELLRFDIKLLVVACNSATAVALDDLRQHLDIPVVGVVEPGLRAAAKASRTHRAMVISTTLTARTRTYERAVERLNLPLEVSTHPCPGFVELVEDGISDTAEALEKVRAQLSPMLTARVDTLVLGCTHFPLLARPISTVVGRRVTLVSSADETAFEVKDLLEHLGWQRAAGPSGTLRVLTTGDPDRFRRLSTKFLQDRASDVVAHRIIELDEFAVRVDQAQLPAVSPRL